MRKRLLKTTKLKTTTLRTAMEYVIGVLFLGGLLLLLYVSIFILTDIIIGG